METKLSGLLLSVIILGLISCTNGKDEPRQQAVTKGTAVNQTTKAMPQEEKKADHMADAPKSPPLKRKYKFPSIMVKEDMYHEDYITPDRTTTLLTNLIVKGWDATGDDYGRTFIYASPELTYAELKEFLHFHDSDVTYVNNARPGELQALIQTDWLICNITFMDKIYNGKDAKVKLKAVVIDIEQKSYSDKETAYRKNRGILSKILDFFTVVHK